MKFLIVLAFVAVGFVQGRMPPSMYQRCSSHPDPNKCILKQTQHWWPQIAKGDPKMHFPSLLPLHVMELKGDVNGQFGGTLKNATLTEFGDIKFKEIDINTDSQHVSVTFYQPIFTFFGHYEVSGKILEIPVAGNGLCNVSFIGLTQKFEFDYNLVEDRKQQQHVHITNHSLTYIDTKDSFYMFTNLFNGDETLGRYTNNFLNLNRRMVYEFLGGEASRVAGNVYAMMLQMFFDKMSLDDLYKL